MIMRSYLELLLNTENGMGKPMEWINKGAKRKKGFTLVEIIVVLVVLAILAAFAIPTMLGFVNDARGKAYIAEAREVYVAAQAIATEHIATTDIMDGNIKTGQTAAHGNQSWGTGLAVSVSSYEVKYRHDHTTGWTKDEPSSPQFHASYEMYRYISNDLLPISDINLLTNPNATPNGHDAAWIIIIGDGTDSHDGVDISQATRTGKVTKVIYKRNGYQVTIAGNDTTVSKY